MSLFCGKRCQDRKDRRLELKYKKKLARIEAKVEKATGRQETRQIAYSQGIDTGSAKSIFGGIAKVAGVVGGTITGTAAIQNLSGSAKASVLNSRPSISGSPGFDIEKLEMQSQQKTGSMGIMAVIAVVLFALFSSTKN